MKIPIDSPILVKLPQPKISKLLKIVEKTAAYGRMEDVYKSLLNFVFS
jgi:hypothetical protein